MKGKAVQLLRKHVWCSFCTHGVPPKIRKSEFLVPVRANHYDLLNGEIDKRVVGVCSECLKGLSDFKRTYAERIDKESISIVYRDELENN